MTVKKIVVFVVLIASACTWAATATWTGAVSTSFTDSANWSPAIDLTDDEGDILTIDAPVTHDPIYNDKLSTRPGGFNVTENGNFTVYGGEFLPYGNNTLNGTVTIKNGWMSSRAYVYVGDGASGTVTVDGGTFSSKYTMYIGRNSGGDGTLNVLEGIVNFPSRPGIGTNGGTGRIYIEEGGFCYISGDDTAWFQSLADAGTITTASGYVIVVDYQSEIDRTRITAEQISGASLPVPWNGTEDTNITTLTWKPGTLATSSRVYLGTDASAVQNATTSDAEYLGSTSGKTMTIPYALSDDTTCYWRVDTIADTGFIQGDLWSFTPVSKIKPRQMEQLDRGLTAIAAGTGNFISWRLFGTDDSDIGFNIYRGQTKLNSIPVTDSTNYLDTGGTNADIYSIRPVLDGQEQDASKSAFVQTAPYHSIAMQQIPGDTDGSYEINDGAVGDLDNDGTYELIVKRYSSDYDEYPVIEAYKLDGTFLWRINLGPNHISMVEVNPIVYDLDGDGFAEVVLRTCEGMTDGVGNYTGDTNNDGMTDYRIFGSITDGFLDKGPEFVTVFDGLTGREIDRTEYIPRVSLSQWGDTYGHRATKFHMVIAYLDGHKPSLVICRGIYALTKLEGFNFRNGQLEKLWHFTSEEWPAFAGQGNHNLSVADVDADGKDEIIYGGMCVDHDGTGLYSTGHGHGDAIHVSDMNPAREGLEVWRCVEGAASGITCTDAATGAVLFEYANAADVGRACAGDIDPTYVGYEMWGSTNCPMYNALGTEIGDSNLSMNFMVWWDGDLLRETLDHAGSTGYWYGTIGKWDYINKQQNTVLAATGTYSNNWTKGNPVLSGDIYGDWREEALWRADDNQSVRIYSTTDITSHRIYTLMHDPQYRMAIAWQCCAYNQPPHPGFYLGNGMDTPPTPYITLVQADPDETDPPAPNPMLWDVRPYQNGNNTMVMKAANAVDASGVEYDFTCTAGPGHNSGWQASPYYEDTNLIEGQVYTYTVTARDQSNNQNTTFASVPASCEIPDVSVVAAWDFEDGVVGTAFSDVSSGGSIDTAGGIVMYGFDPEFGPSFSPVTPTNTGLSLYCNGGQDGYTTDAAFNAWSPQTWTIEISVRLDDISNWETIVGRDGSSAGQMESDFYLQKNGTDGAFRLNILTVGGVRRVLDADFAVQAYQWYRLAITSDGTAITMYCDKLDGNGYQPVGSLDISDQTPAQNALAQGGYNWTFGRGWHNGGFTDHITGYMDNIRFSDTVLSVDQFLGSQSNSIPWLDGDFTGNHVVDLDDFAVFSKLWQWQDCDSLIDVDLDDDCTVGLTEFSMMADNWMVSD